MHHVLHRSEVSSSVKNRLPHDSIEVAYIVYKFFQVTLGAMSVAGRAKNNNQVETLVGLLHNPQCVHLPGGRSGRVG